MKIPILTFKLKYPKESDRIKLYLPHFKFKRKTSQRGINHAVSFVDYDPFSDSDEHAWLPSNQEYYDDQSDENREEMDGYEKWSTSIESSYDRRPPKGTISQEKADQIVDLLYNKDIEELAFQDDNGDVEDIIKDGSVINQGWTYETRQSDLVVIKHDDSDLDQPIFVQFAKESSGYRSFDYEGLSSSQGLDYRSPFVFAIISSFEYAEDDSDWLKPAIEKTYFDDYQGTVIQDPNDHDIGYAVKTENEDGDKTRYWQVGVERGSVPDNIVSLQFYLGKDNKIYTENTIEDDNRVLPPKTKIFISEKFYKAQKDAIKALIDARYNENIEITANDLYDPRKIDDLELFTWCEIYDQNGYMKLLPVSEISETNDKTVVKLGFKTTLFTEIVKKGR